jgi:hypothetical protein
MDDQEEIRDIIILKITDRGAYNRFRYKIEGKLQDEFVIVVLERDNAPLKMQQGDVMVIQNFREKLHRGVRIISPTSKVKINSKEIDQLVDGLANLQLEENKQSDTNNQLGINHKRRTSVKDIKGKNRNNIRGHSQNARKRATTVNDTGKRKRRRRKYKSQKRNYSHSDQKEYTPLSKIGKNSRRVHVHVRVIAINMPIFDETVEPMNLRLVDKDKTMIEALIYGNLINKFKGKVEIKKVYEIKNFRTVPTK